MEVAYIKTGKKKIGFGQSTETDKDKKINS